MNSTGKRIDPGTLSVTGTRHRAGSEAARGDLVFFLLDTVPQLDLRRFYAPYETETRGAPVDPPSGLPLALCLLRWRVSSRKIALACERNWGFSWRLSARNAGVRTIGDFRKQHLEAFKYVC